MGLFTKVLVLAIVAAVLSESAECRSVSRSGRSRSLSRSFSGSFSSSGSSNRIVKTSDDGHSSVSVGGDKARDPSKSGPNLGKDSRRESVDHVQPRRCQLQSRRHRTETTATKTSTTPSIAR